MEVVRNISGEYIRRMRKQCGISRKILCRKMRQKGFPGYTVERIRAIEEGREMAYDTDLWAISQALKIVPDELFPMEKLLGFLFD